MNFLERFKRFRKYPEMHNEIMVIPTCPHGASAATLMTSDEQLSTHRLPGNWGLTFTTVIGLYIAYVQIHLPDLLLDSPHP